MKLMIDTDSDNVILKCNGFHGFELCQALDRLLEEVAEELDTDADFFKEAFIVTFKAAIKARKENGNDDGRKQLVQSVCDSEVRRGILDSGILWRLPG